MAEKPDREDVLSHFENEVIGGLDISVVNGILRLLSGGENMSLQGFMAKMRNPDTDTYREAYNLLEAMYRVHVQKYGRD